MKNKEIQNIDVAKVRKMFPSLSEIGIESDFFLASVKGRQNDSLPKEPFRMDGYVVIICLEGDFDIEMNMRHYQLGKKESFTYIPGNILQIRSESQEWHCILLAMSADYMSRLNMNIDNLFNDSMTILDTPCFQLTDKDLHLCSSYALLAKELLSTDISHGRREALGSLIMSLCYSVGSSWRDHIIQGRKEKGLLESSREKEIFDHFTQLVHEHHNEHRDLEFYASRMYLTPKYLSRTIKHVCGRTASAWIDSFVVLEAKNMLRNTDMSIKEIMLKLNFSSHSIFYTFFKSHTGLSPSEYRKKE